MYVLIVYYSQDSRVAIVNVRSHCVEGKSQAFCREIYTLLKACGAGTNNSTSISTSTIVAGPVFVALAGLGDEGVEDEHQVFR